MRQCAGDVSLDEALADPVVRAVMAADRVDPQELRTMLKGIIATRNQGVPQSGTGWRLYPPGPLST